MMFKVAVFACSAAVVLGQFLIGDWFQEKTYLLDDIHGHEVQYDDGHDLILLIGQADCFLVSAPDKEWDKYLTHPDQVVQVTQDLYHQIRLNIGVTHITQHAADIKYHSNLEAWNCRTKQIFEVAFTPATTTPRPTTPTTTPNNK